MSHFVPKEGNLNQVPLILSSNTQTVMHTPNSTYETKNNENSCKERRFRRNNQEIIEQSWSQRPPNKLIEIVESYQKAR